jgi:hypothetical protein
MHRNAVFVYLYDVELVVSFVDNPDTLCFILTLM